MMNSAAESESNSAALKGGKPGPQPSRTQVRAPTSADAMVGHRIRSLRSAAGLTQKGLAARIGVTNAQLYRYETGATRVAASRLLAIAESLGVGVEELIEKRLPRPPIEIEAQVELDKLRRAFVAIKDPQHRKALVSLAHSMAKVDGEA